MKIKNRSSDVKKFRDEWLKKGFELINITSLCEPKLGCNGWCNDINEPEESFHHIQMWYRDEIVANITNNKVEIIDEDKYVVFNYNNGFIIFKKCKI